MTDTFASPPPAGPTQRAADPTAVVGRRVVAALLDTVIYFAIVIALFAALAVQVPSLGLDDACGELRTIGVSEVCFQSGDDVYYLERDSDSLLITMVSLGWFVLVYVIMQGLSGATPGKLLTGLRVIRPDGEICGMPASLLRSLMWVVDAAPWFPPAVVAFVTSLTSSGHRRLGDMVAKTYVVATADVGTPIQVGGTTGIPNYAPGPGTPAPGTSWTPPPGAQAPTPPQTQPWAPPEPAATAPAPDQQWAPPAAPSSSELPREPPASPPTVEMPPPQWDAARNTYIQWDPNARRWLQWNEPAKRWDPIT